MTTCHRIAVSAALAVFIAVPSAARADGFNYPDFSSTAGLNLVQDAQSVGNVLSLNYSPVDPFFAVGAAWHIAQQQVDTAFETMFDFRIDQDGADGFAFVVQSISVDAYAGAGGDLGYGWMPQSIAVEFDTWQGVEIGDPNDNHIAVQSAGDGPNTPSHLGGATYGITNAIPFLSDGRVHTARVAYGGGTLGVYVDDLINPALLIPMDIASIITLNGGKAWVGFTGATGGATENHEILNWEFQSAAPVPEPGSAALLVSGLAPLGFVLRRRARR